ncbi:uncharacterized protein LOC131224900 [Magnolia sinica]|uniref:uncharacterized protein LOC131224900 n=1 Tax=Magnolia sinica TaxID=86752 RepID=UPI00265A0595|nr:uncharacterized protein LOC131224900 [Magnolia sinica]
MAVGTASLLEPIPSFFPNSKPLSPKWNPLLQSLPILSLTSSTPIVRFSKPNLPPIKCSNSSKKIESLSREQHNPFQTILDAVFKTLKSLQKLAIAAVLLGVLLAYDSHSAIATIGGRMGGGGILVVIAIFVLVKELLGPTIELAWVLLLGVVLCPDAVRGWWGCYMGPAVGVGVGTGSGFFMLMMGFVAAILVLGFLSDQRFK